VVVVLGEEVVEVLVELRLEQPHCRLDLILLLLEQAVLV
jgi:hypothetical protein